MTEMMWFTLGFLTTLAIITIADVAIQCHTERK